VYYRKVYTPEYKNQNNIKMKNNIVSNWKPIVKVNLWFMSEFPSKRVAAYKGFKWPSRRYHFERNTVLTSLTVTEYLSHRWPRIYSVCRSNNPVFSLLMKCHLRLNNINTHWSTKHHTKIKIKPHDSHQKKPRVNSCDPE
jgi:hypothetical protein